MKQTSNSVTIKADNITRCFGDLCAVDSLSISVHKGEIFGLLGPNASGKSTTIRLLAGILALDAGSVEILGENIATDIDSIRHRIGYVSQNYALYDELTVEENVNFYKEIYANAKSLIPNKELFDTYGLADFVDNQASTLSGGYKRRLAIACAVAHDPELIFLDEPTAGIDPISRKELWELFFLLGEQGKTLFVTTHYMEEAERCDRLAFLDHGKLVALDSPERLKQISDNLLVYACQSKYQTELAQQLKTLEGVNMLNQFGSELRILTDKNLDKDKFLKLLSEYDIKQEQVQITKTTIEDVFIHLTGDN